MESRNFLSELEELAKSQDNWYSIATICEKLKERTTENTRPAIHLKDAAKAAKYSYNMLNRQVSVKVFLDNVKDRIKKYQKIDFDTVSFAGLELAKRLYQVDAENGLSMLHKVVAGKIKHRDLLAYYTERMTELNGRSAGHMARMEANSFRDQALKVIKKKTRDLFKAAENADSMQISEHSSFADAVITSSSLSGLTKIGIVFEAGHNPENKDRAKSSLEKMLLYGNFFDEFWIVCPENVEWCKTDLINSILDIFKKNSYGIMTISLSNASDCEEEHINVIRTPSGQPEPDMRNNEDEFEEAIKEFCA